MAMVPHERSLVTRLQGKPFALVGVNYDKDKEYFKRIQKAARISWRSWWDGDSGLIGKTYQIRGLPTVYVIDPQGMIRFKNIEGKQLDQAVDRLLAETGGKLPKGS